MIYTNYSFSLINYLQFIIVLIFYNLKNESEYK